MLTCSVRQSRSAVIDPVGSVPVFIALTQKMDKPERASITKTAIITAAGLLFVFAVLIAAIAVQFVVDGVGELFAQIC